MRTASRRSRAVELSRTLSRRRCSSLSTNSRCVVLPTCASPALFLYFDVHMLTLALLVDLRRTPNNGSPVASATTSRTVERGTPSRRSHCRSFRRSTSKRRMRTLSVLPHLTHLSTLERQSTDFSSTFLVVGGLAGSHARNDPPFRSFLPTPHANAPTLPSVHVIPRSSSRPDAREDYRPRFELQERSEPTVCEPTGRRTGRGVFNGRVFLCWRSEQEELG